ncbi:MAG: chondroitinase family polysaccharide lyase, partial [Candidatus Latescibacteria bacterium]|nr:chondroitinase family polysaccharide lyase [Candidatus Latescibacterota bacterium]
MGEMTIALFALALVLATRARAWGQAMRYCETFEEGVPDDFSATRTESLSTSPWHYKQGSRSLRWDWRRGEEMVIRHGIGDVSRVGGFGAVAGFSVWLYMENPIPDALVFEFREGERVTGSFRFPTDFTGWKQARPHFSDFPQGKPTSAVDNIRIAAPEATSEGTAFLDFIKFNTLTHRGSAVVPEREAEWVAPVPDERRFPKPEQVTESEAAGLRKLLGPEQGEGIEDAQAEELCGLVDSLGIVRDEHGVRGPGIDAYYQFHPSADEQTALGPGYWPDEHGPDWMGMQTPGAMASLVRRVASAYRASNAAGQRQRLAERFFLIADHLHDQALQARSGFRWNWWVGGSWADALFLMRDLLAETGRLQPHLDFQLYTYGASALFDDADPPSQMDFYHLTVPSLYRQCLMQVDAAEQVRWLNAFKAMLERSMTQPTSALKIDGSAYHHNGHYHSYAKNAFGTLPPLLLSLNDTPWRLSADARERLRRAELAQRIYCNRIHVPLSLCGRSPFRKGYGYMNSHALAGLETLARCGSPDGTQAVDREVAAAYLRLSPEAAAEEPYRDFGIDPEPEPSGTFVMPYAALLCHRREDWLASVKGQSKYCWGTERQDHHNRFGLFQGMGQLEIL